jgi:hypothetical protein
MTDPALVAKKLALRNRLEALVAVVDAVRGRLDTRS